MPHHFRGFLRKGWGMSSNKLHPFAGVKDAEGVATAGPDQHQRILPLRDFLQRVLHLACGVNIMPIDLGDDVATLQASLVRWSARQHTVDNGAPETGGSLELIPQLGREIGESDAPARFLLTVAGAFRAVLIPRTH